MFKPQVPGCVQTQGEDESNVPAPSNSINLGYLGLALSQICALKLKFLGPLVTNRNVYLGCRSVAPSWPAARSRGIAAGIAAVQSTRSGAFQAASLARSRYTNKFIICQHARLHTYSADLGLL